MNKKLLEEAVSGDNGALNQLSAYPPVFVAPGGDLDADATLAAWQYYQDFRTVPDEWNDEPTVDFATAFPRRERLNPLTLKPVTPGLWANLWDKCGHEVVAAIYWGVRSRTIQGSEVEIKLLVRQHLETPNPLVAECVQLMSRNEETKRQAMKAVYAPLAPQVQEPPQATVVVIAPGVEKRQGLQRALEDLENEYSKGYLDMGRYLRLKADLETQLRASYTGKLEHSQAVALIQFIHARYSLDEFRTLVFRVGLRYDDLSGGTFERKVYNLVDNRQRRGLTRELAEVVKMDRPVAWAREMW